MDEKWMRLAKKRFPTAYSAHHCEDFAGMNITYVHQKVVSYEDLEKEAGPEVPVYLTREQFHAVERLRNEVHGMRFVTDINLAIGAKCYDAMLDALDHLNDLMRVPSAPSSPET